MYIYNERPNMMYQLAVRPSAWPQLRSLVVILRHLVSHKDKVMATAMVTRGWVRGERVDDIVVMAGASGR